MQNLTITFPGQAPYTTDVSGFAQAIRHVQASQSSSLGQPRPVLANLPIPANPQSPIYRCGVTVNDVAMDHISRQIVDMIRKLHYEVGLQEHQFPDVDSMIINLGQVAEQDMLNTLETNHVFSGGILEHVDEYYPAITRSVRETEVVNYLINKYSEYLHAMTSALQPALAQVINEGYFPTSVEKFNVNSTTSYYLLTGELGNLL